MLAGTVSGGSQGVPPTAVAGVSTGPEEMLAAAGSGAGGGLAAGEQPKSRAPVSKGPVSRAEVAVSVGFFM
ncbi:MAG TPA: hypothetical protein PLN33_21580 [Hyphomonadaceae bacterium]|nr:hypothetical protein [Hyphomonadaceae bacterium]